MLSRRKLNRRKSNYSYFVIEFDRDMKEVASAASFFFAFLRGCKPCYNPISLKKRGLVLQFFCTFTHSFSITGMPSKS